MPVNVNYTTEKELQEDFEEYVTIALANGFSKGTANVSPADMKKLRGLISHYRGMKHPFSACVRDNRKRFGPLTEKYCAVLKDLIEGHTHWRNKKKNLSEETLRELFTLSEVPDGFFYAISELNLEDAEGDGIYLSEDEVMAEVYLAGYPTETKGDLIYKVIAKEGTWKYSPGPGQMPTPKPLTFVPEGSSNKDNLVVSIEELKQNFDSGAKQYVTVPLTHEDRVLDNTGFIKDMVIDKDEDGKTILKAGIQFTEPEVRERVERGSIADISSGIHFDYIKKDDGQKFNAVIAHAALTNHPWLNGMKPFEVDASENLEIWAFSEEDKEYNKETSNLSEGETQLPLGGEKVPEVTEEKQPEVVVKEVPVAPVFLTEMGISEDEAKARLAEYASLKAEQKRNRVDEQCRKWQEEGVSPALVLAAKSILDADEGVAILNLSENGREATLTASDIVDRLIEATPKVKLNEDKITDKDVQGKAPAADAEDENEKAKLSLEERTLVSMLMFDASMSQEEAIAEAKRRLSKNE